MKHWISSYCANQRESVIISKVYPAMWHTVGGGNERFGCRHEIVVETGILDRGAWKSIRDINPLSNPAVWYFVCRFTYGSFLDNPVRYLRDNTFPAEQIDTINQTVCFSPMEQLLRINNPRNDKRKKEETDSKLFQQCERFERNRPNQLIN